MKENEKSDNEKIKSENFFKKVWNSITKIEKYPDMAAEGVGKAITYISKLVALVAIVIVIATLVQTKQMVKKGVEYLQNEFPDFSYKNGELNINSEDNITISEENSVVRIYNNWFKGGRRTNYK